MQGLNTKIASLNLAKPNKPAKASTTVSADLDEPLVLAENMVLNT